MAGGLVITYTAQVRGFVRGRTYANPRFFTSPRAGAAKVIVVGNWPEVEAAYRAIGVPVEVVGGKANGTASPEPLEGQGEAQAAEPVQAASPVPDVPAASPGPPDAVPVQPGRGIRGRRSTKVATEQQIKDLPWPELKAMAEKAAPEGTIVVSRKHAMALIAAAAED